MNLLWVYCVRHYHYLLVSNSPLPLGTRILCPLKVDVVMWLHLANEMSLCWGSTLKWKDLETEIACKYWTNSWTKLAELQGTLCKRIILFCDFLFPRHFGVVFFFFLIYLTMLGHSCGTRNLWSLLWHASSSAVACRIFSCGMRTLSCGMWDLVPWPGI